MRLIRMLILLFLMPMLGVAALLGCTQSGKPVSESAGSKSDGIRKEDCRGPVCVRVTTDKSSMSIAESLVLTLEVEVEEGYEAELPGFGEKLGELGIKDYREDPPRLTADSRILYKKTYTLEPFLSGDYTLEPMQVRFLKKREATTGAEGASIQSPPEEGEIATEAITVRVNSLLEKDQKELTLNPIRGPVSLPAGPIPVYPALAIAGVVFAAGGAYLFFRRRKLRGFLHDTPPIPPHELAFTQLQDILDEKLIERGLYKLFFSRISDVLREYIENRFGIHAPKRTTQEFFAEISMNAPFSPEQKGILVEFLHHCDLVKFAEHQPSEEQVLDALKSCRALIEATSSEPQESITADR